jgi:hypothetical protein
MASRDDNLKPTNQELAKVIRDREGISLEEAEKKQTAEAWKEEADALPVRLIHKRLDYNQKPLRYMLDPNEDPHRDLKSYGYEMKFKGQDFAFEIPMDLDQVSFDGSAKAITEHLNKPIFGDHDDPLLSGKAKHEEVQKQKAKLYPERTTPDNSFWLLREPLKQKWHDEPMRHVWLTKDAYLTDAWNSLPVDHPLYQMGSKEFYRIYCEFHPLLMAVSDVAGSIEGSLIVYDQEFKNQCDWHQVSEEKKEIEKEIKKYIDRCPPKYLELFHFAQRKVRENIITFREGLSRHQHIIDAHIDIHYAWEESHGNVTQKDLKGHLLEKAPDVFPRDKYDGNKVNWQTPMKIAKRFVPLATAWEKDYNRKQTPDQDVQRWLNSAPSGVPDLT